MVHLRRFLLALLALVTLALPRTHAADGPVPTLTAEDRAFLERVYTDCGLVDPRGAVRLRFASADWTPDSPYHYRAYGAWLLPGRDGQPGVIVYGNGLPVPLPFPADMVVSPVDFIGTCGALYGEVEPPEPDRMTEEEKAERYARRQSREAAQRLRMPPDSAMAVLDDPVVGDSGLVSAAWLMRLGREDLAANAMGFYRKTAAADQPAILEQISESIKWRSQSLAEGAFMEGQDARADAILTWNEQRYGPIPPRPDAQPTLRAELERRRALGHFGVVRDATLPEGLATWPVAQRLDWLIDSLDDVTNFGLVSQFHEVLIVDPRALAIVELSDAAVPTLLQAMATDDRLSRDALSHYMWWYASPAPVKELIGALLPKILRLDGLLGYFGPKSANSETQWHPPDYALEVYTLYWQRYGHLTLDQRLMAMLTDPQADRAARRECARSLSMIDIPYRRDEQSYFASTVQQPPAGAPNPLNARYQNPTVAEAILAAMADEQQAITADLDARRIPMATRETWLQPQTALDSEPYGILTHYLTSLECLRDGRIAPALAARAATIPSYRQRFDCAKTAAVLGDFSAITAMGDAWARGELTFRPEQGRGYRLDQLIDQLVLSGEQRFAPAIAAAAMAVPTTKELDTRCKWTRQAVALGDTSAVLQLAMDIEAGRLLPRYGSDAAQLANLLLSAHLPATDRAFRALMSPDGPGYATVYAKGAELLHRDGPWLQTPEGLAMLGRWLADAAPTGIVYVRAADATSVHREGPDAQIYWCRPVPDGDDLTRYDTRVELRVCDSVADVAALRILGLPDFHAMHRDRDAQIAAIRATLSRYGERLQVAATASEHLPFFLPLPLLTADATLPDPDMVFRRKLGADWYRFALPPLDHAATPADVEAGRALFHLDGRGTRLDLALPAWAEVLPATPGATAVYGQVLQAERAADGQVVYGVLTRHSLSRLPADRVRPLSADDGKALLESAARLRQAFEDRQRKSTHLNYRGVFYIDL